jgi:hypothetical protein
MYTSASNAKGAGQNAGPLDFPGGPGRTRTFGQLIKSQLLCQLSYRPKEHGIMEKWNTGTLGQKQKKRISGH